MPGSVFAHASDESECHFAHALGPNNTRSKASMKHFRLARPLYVYRVCAVIRSNTIKSQTV